MELASEVLVCANSGGRGALPPRLTCSLKHGNDLRAKRHGDVEIEAGENLRDLVELVVARLQEEVRNVGAEEQNPVRCCAAIG